MQKKGHLKNIAIKIISLTLVMSFLLPLSYLFYNPAFKKAEAVSLSDSEIPGVEADEPAEVVDLPDDTSGSGSSSGGGGGIGANAGSVAGAALSCAMPFIAEALGIGGGTTAAATAAVVSVPTFSLTEFAVAAGTMFSTNFLQLKDACLDGIAKMVAQIIIRQVSASIVNWINGGFEGGPGFVTDPKAFFMDIGNEVSGEFIRGAGLDFLCSPFRMQIKLALAAKRSSKSNFANRSQCTLTGILDNAENFNAFVGGDFSVGGWGGWFSMTQNPQNNFRDALVMAEAEMELRIGSEKNTQSVKLNWGKGFLSWDKCVEYEEQDSSGGSEGPKPKCLKKKIATPGSVIQEQLNQVLPSELRGLEVADEINEIIGALVGQLINKVMTGVGGLAGASQKSGGGSGKSFTDDWQDEDNTKGLKDSAIKSIDKSIKMLQDTKYAKIKKETIDALQVSEDGLNILMACYNTKLATSLSEQRKLVATQGIADAQAMLNPPINFEDEPITGITPLKTELNSDIQNTTNDASVLIDIKNQLLNSTTLESATEAIHRYNLYIEERGLLFIQDVKSEKKNIVNKLKSVNSETKKMTKKCEKWGSATDISDEGDGSGGGISQ